MYMHRLSDNQSLFTTSVNRASAHTHTRARTRARAHTHTHTHLQYFVFYFAHNMTVLFQTVSSHLAECD